MHYMVGFYPHLFHNSSACGSAYHVNVGDYQVSFLNMFALCYTRVLKIRQESCIQIPSNICFQKPVSPIIISSKISGFVYENVSNTLLDHVILSYTFDDDGGL